MHKFDPKHLERLLNPERRKWQDPDLILDALGLAPGMTFADIGAGPGFFALPAAIRVGQTGKVYALDIEPEMLAFLKDRLSTEGIINVEVLPSQEDEIPLPDGTVDVALLANVLHESNDRVGLLREVARILRPASTFGVVEWRKDSGEMGPPQNERLTPEEVKAALQAVGFHHIDRFEVGPYHYGIRARR